MRIRKYAAIDIGSNAVRLLISNVIESKQQTQFFKNSLVRVPIRLGEDSFTSGKISNRNINRLLESIQSFKILMNVHGVENYLAYATSALRDAKNGHLIVNEILNKTGINIEIINGKREAKIISKQMFFNRLILIKHIYTLMLEVGVQNLV